MGVIYRRYAKIIKKPRVHPVIQIMATEWRRLESLGSSPPNWEKGLPIWGNVTVSMVETACKAVAVKNPDWHADLSAQDISQYLRDVSAAKRWWIPGSKGDEDGTSVLSLRCLDCLHITYSCNGRCSGCSAK